MISRTTPTKPLYYIDILHFNILRVNQDLMEIIILPILLLIYLDVDRINVPVWQFAYLDESYSLLCDSDVYSLEQINWTGPHSEENNGTISSAEIEDEGIYSCSFVIMGAKSNSFTTTLHVLGKIIRFCN